MTGAILMAAPNGARKTTADHPNLPITADEVAAEAARCLIAGATALHLHVRDAGGAHSLDADLYRKATDAVRDAVGDALVVQITTEAVERFTAEEQMACVRAVKPEAVSIALREVYPEGSDEARVRDFFGWMSGEGIWAQVILYDSADADRFATLMDGGLFAAARPSVLAVLGRYTAGQRSDPSDLDPFLVALEPVRESIEWSLCAFGAKENACVARAFAEGGHGRVGFENNFLRPDGSVADHTSELVALAGEAARQCGRTVLDASAARQVIANWV